MLQDIDITIEQLTGEITALTEEIAAIGKQMPQLHQAVVEAAYNRGVAYVKKGDLIHAIIDLNFVVEKDPSYAKGYYYRGVAYLQRKEWVKAAQDFTRARRGGVNIIESFNEDFGGVLDFQCQHRFELPSNLVHLLKED